MFYFSFLHFPLSGPVLTNISLPIIPCMIVYVTIIKNLERDTHTHSLSLSLTHTHTHTLTHTTRTYTHTLSHTHIHTHTHTHTHSHAEFTYRVELKLLVFTGRLIGSNEAPDRSAALYDARLDHRGNELNPSDHIKHIKKS